MKKKRIKTKGALKEEILEYLQDAAEKKDWKVEDFTLSSISKHVRDREKRVGDALDELEGEETEVVKTIKIETKIYLPQTDDGKRIAKELAKKKLIRPLSPYAAFTIAIVILLIAAPYVVSDVREALVIALIFGLILASVLQWGFREFMKWRATLGKMNEDLARISKSTVGLSLLFFGIYYMLIKLTESKMTPEGILTTFFSSIAVAFSYTMLRRGK